MGAPDSLASCVHAGKPISARVFDAHGHLGPYFNFPISRCRAEGMIEAMDRIGVDRIALSHHMAIASDWVRGNTLTAEAAARFPERITAYAVANPHEWREIPGELARAFAAGASAVKLHPSLHEYPVNGPHYRPAFEFAAERTVPVLTHTWKGCAYSSPEKTADVAREFPPAPVLFGHTGGGTLAGMTDSVRAAGELENAYFELCCSCPEGDWVERLVAEVGAGRVLYGSDAPFLDWGAQLGKVVFADLSEEAKRAILGENAYKLFKL